MTICFEFDGRCNLRPGSVSNSIMWRGWWWWFAVCIVRIPFERFATEAHDWRIDGRIVDLANTHQARAVASRPECAGSQEVSDGND